MLKRCYSSRTQAKYPSYKGCTVCTEWLTFSNFKKWLTECSDLSLQLDKDLLVEGNKVYSPETCVMISGVINNFISLPRILDDLPLGVHVGKGGKYKSSCSNPFTRKVIHLGTFCSPDEAHEAWRAQKHIFAVQLAETVNDIRVSDSLKSRYLKNVI